MSLKSNLLLGAVLIAGVGSAAPAFAGCNGVVDQLRWGCAVWDNNNGPQYPYYKAKFIPVPGLNVPAGTALQVRGADLVDAKTGKLVASGGGNLVASGGGNLVASGGGNLVAQGGGNVVVRQ